MTAHEATAILDAVRAGRPVSLVVVREALGVRERADVTVAALLMLTTERAVERAQRAEALLAEVTRAASSAWSASRPPPSPLLQTDHSTAMHACRRIERMVQAGHRVVIAAIDAVAMRGAA